MNRNLPKLAFAVALAMLGAGGAAARTVYECSIEERGTNHGALPTIVVVAVDPGVEDVLVSDPMIQHVHGQPISVTPRANNESRLTLRWKLTLEATDQSEWILTYDFSILKSNLSAKITAMPHGYDNTFSSQGSCTAKQD